MYIDLMTIDIASYRKGVTARDMICGMAPAFESRGGEVNLYPKSGVNCEKI